MSEEPRRWDLIGLVALSLLGAGGTVGGGVQYFEQEEETELVAQELTKTIDLYAGLVQKCVDDHLAEKQSFEARLDKSQDKCEARLEKAQDKCEARVDAVEARMFEALRECRQPAQVGP